MMVHRISFVLILSLLVFAICAFGQASTSDINSITQMPVLGSDVTAYGAIGDGKADDTDAVEKALKSAKGTVCFPKGRYRIIRTIRIDLDALDRVSLIGTGSATIIMAGPGPAFYFIGTHEGSAGPESFKDNVWLRQRSPLVMGIEILGEHPEAIGLCFEKTMQATLTSLCIRRCKIAVQFIKRNRNPIIDHCHIYHNTQIGIDFDHVNLHQAIISDSHISYNPVAGIRLFGGEMRNFQIVGNDIEYNYSPEVQDSADILIDMRPEGSSFREGTIVGNTIQARPSPNGANVRLLGGEKLRTAGLMAISGNLIGSQTYGIHLVNCRSVTISGNSIYSSAAHSLWFQDSANIVASGNSIDWNPDHKQKSLVDGMLIERCKGVIVSDSIIENCFQGSEKAGGAIDIKESQDVSLVNCQILDPKFRGVTLSDALRCRVIGCTIINRTSKPAKYSSIELLSGSDNLIADNFVNPDGLKIASDTAITRNNIETDIKD